MIPIPDPHEQPSVSLWPTAGRLLGMGRSLCYELVARGEFPVPVYRVGRLIRVPTAPLLAFLGLHKEVAG